MGVLRALALILAFFVLVLLALYHAREVGMENAFYLKKIGSAITGALSKTMRSGVTLVSENGIRHYPFSELLFKKEKCLRAEYKIR